MDHVGHFPEEGQVLLNQSALCFRVPRKAVRGAGDSILHYLAWFGIELPDDVRQEWEQTEWVISMADRDRVVHVHALAAGTPFDGAAVSCVALNARSVNYDMREVTGLDYSVLRTILMQVVAPRVLRDTVEKVEAFNLPKVGLRCRGGTHRSVAMCHLLLLLVYPLAVFYPSTRHVQRAATRFWQSEWP